MDIYGGKVDTPVRAWLDASLVTVSGDCCVTIPVSLVPFIVGALEEYRLPDMWYGDDMDVIFALKVFETLVAELSAVINVCGQNSGCGNVPCESEDYMSDPCLPIKIDDGVLSFKSKCGDWEVVGKVGDIGVSGKDVLPDVTTDDPVVQEDWRCLKANIIGNLIWTVSEAIRDVIEDVLPTKFISEVEKRAGIQLNTSGMIAVWGVYYSHKIVLSEFMDADFSDAQKSDFICKFSQVADGSTTNISDREYDRISAVMAQTMGLDVIATGFFENVIIAIDRPRFQSAVNMAVAADMEFDCPCIGGSSLDTPPEGTTWFKVFDFSLGSYGFTASGSASCRYSAGVGFITDALDGGGANMPEFYRSAGSDTSTPPIFRFVRTHCKLWPPSLTVGGGYASLINVGGVWRSVNAANRGQEWPSSSIEVEVGYGTPVRFGWNEWFQGAGNNPYSTLVNRVLIAGTGDGAGWVGLQPDGSWIDPS